MIKNLCLLAGSMLLLAGTKEQTATAAGSPVSEWRPPTSINRTNTGVVGATRSRWHYNRNLNRTPERAVDIGQDEHGPIIRVNLLRIRDWSLVPGVLKHWDMPKYEDTEFAWHAARSCVLDCDGDGKLDVFVVHGGSHYQWKPGAKLYDQAGRVIRVFPSANARAVRLDESGAVVWARELGEPSGSEAMHVVDMENDGTKEVIFLQDGKLHALDAATGTPRWEVQIDRERGIDFTMGPLVGNFTDPDHLGVLIKVGRAILCFDHSGKQVWQTATRGGNGGNITHYDADGDGLEEIFVHADNITCGIDHNGVILWEDLKQGRHSDTMAFGDISGDGRIETAYDHGVNGPLIIADALTGAVKRKINYKSLRIRDVNTIAAADFCPDLPGLEIACTSSQYDQFAAFVTLFKSDGSAIRTIKAPIADFDVADWDRDGAADILGVGLGCNPDPAFSVWNGKGERLYALSLLPSPTVPIYEYGDYVYGTTTGSNADRNANGRPDFRLAWGAWHFGSDQMILLMESSDERNRLRGL